MRRNLFMVYCLLITVLFSCNSQTSQTFLQTTFYIYRFDPPSFVEFSQDLEMVKEIPFSIPVNCGLLNTFPAPIGEYLLIELNCPNGQTILFLDTNTASTIQPITDTDSHFLAWTADGQAAYLKADSLGDAHIVRVDASGKNDFIPLTEFTYDLSTNLPMMISLLPSRADWVKAVNFGLRRALEKLCGSCTPIHSITFPSHVIPQTVIKLRSLKSPIRRLRSRWASCGS